jgi:drug/metabolite transporter (DMT)-like permease
LKLHTASGNWQVGLGLSIVTVLLWGLIPLALGVVLQSIDIATVNAFRFLSSFVLLGCYLASRRQLPTVKQLQATSPILMLVAIGGLTCNYLFFTKGLVATSPSHAEVLIQLAHLFFGFGGLLIFKETYSRKQLVGLGILVLGLVGFFNQQLAVVAATEKYWAGSAMLAFAGLTWAIYALAQKQMLQQLSSGQIMWIIYGCCGVIFGIFSHPASVLTMSTLQWGMLIFAGLNTFVAYGAFAESLAHWPASKVSAVLAIVTLVAMSILAPWLSLHAEQITPLGIAGAIAVVVGSVSIALNDRSNRSK